MDKQSQAFSEIRDKLKTVLTSKRYTHSLGVMTAAEKLARLNGYNSEKAALAGLVHDCARDIKGSDLIEACSKNDIKVTLLYKAQPELLHGPLGAKLIRLEYCIDDPEIENAVRIHTTGCENMSLLDKIVFAADFIEPGRNFPGVEGVRQIALHDLNEAVLLSIDMTIRHVMEKHEVLLHPDTILARNHLLLEKRGLAGGMST